MGKKKPKVEQKTIVTAYLGTKSDMVVKELDVMLKDIVKDYSFNDKAVIAKDDNGLYVTGKSYVDALVLDPFRRFRKVVVTENEGNYSFA